MQPTSHSFIHTLFAKPNEKVIPLDAFQAPTKLLDIDKRAELNREQTRLASIQSAQDMNQQFHQWLIKDIRKTVEMPGQHLFSLSSLKIEDLQCLDKIANPNITYSALANAIYSRQWLAKEVIKFTQESRFRSKTITGNGIKPIQNAVRLLGIELTQLVLSSIIYKRTIPTITDPFPAFKFRQWEYSIILSNCMYVLAKDLSKQPQSFFQAVLFLNVGINFLSKLFFSSFSELQQAQLKSAELANMQSQYELLRQLTPDLSYLNKLTDAAAPQLALKLAQAMDLKHIKLVPIIAKLNLGNSKITTLYQAVEQTAQQYFRHIYKYEKTFSWDSTPLWTHLNERQRKTITRINLRELDLY